MNTACPTINDRRLYGGGHDEESIQCVETGTGVRARLLVGRMSVDVM
jgi:hypothetical protein